MRVFYTIAALLLCQSFGFTQDNVVVEIIVKDRRYFDPVRNARVALKFDSITESAWTNTYGISYFTVPLESKLIFDLEHFNFFEHKYERRISKNEKRDTVSYVFTMDFRRHLSLEEVVAPAPGIPVAYFGNDDMHVSDFEVMNNGDVLLLTYPKRLKKGSGLLVWDGKKVKLSYDVPEESEELVKDYRGNPHLICKDAVVGVHVTNDQIGFSSLDKGYYFKYLAPILDTNKSKMYFSNFSKDYPAFDYFSYDRLDSTYSKILEIKDDLMMELYRSEYKWVDVRTKLWAKNKEIQSGIDAEIWVGANYFTQSIYYKELYAPLFHRNDTLFVFDYYSDYLRTFDALGNKIDSMEIHHHYDKRNTGWQNNLIQDPITGQIYALFDRNGYTYLGWINSSTGAIDEQVQLEYRYAHNVAVNNNQIYYIYRPFESRQKKYLYRERLPYNFGGAKTPKGELVTRQ